MTDWMAPTPPRSVLCRSAAASFVNIFYMVDNFWKRALLIEGVVMRSQFFTEVSRFCFADSIFLPGPPTASYEVLVEFAYGATCKRVG